MPSIADVFGGGPRRRPTSRYASSSTTGAASCARSAIRMLCRTSWWPDGRTRSAQRVTTSASRSNARPAERTRRSRALKFRDRRDSRAILVPAPPNGPSVGRRAMIAPCPGNGMGRIQRPTWAVPIVQMGTLWTPIDRVHRAIGTLHRNVHRATMERIPNGIPPIGHADSCPQAPDLASFPEPWRHFHVSPSGRS